MARNESKLKIVLEGEKEYSAALQSARRNLKTLKSEEKATAAEMKNSATAQEKAAARSKSLTQQIREQEKVVAILRAELEQVREKYGDNEAAVARYEQQLNSARTVLAGMRNDLASVGQDMETMGHSGDGAVVAAKSLADSFGRLGEMSGSAADAVGQAFSTMVSGVTSAVAGLWDKITSLAAQSNNLVDLAGYWGTDVTTIQKYKGAVESASGSLEDLNQLVTKINQADPQKLAELTGISPAKYEDQWALAMAVMDRLSQMDTKTRNAAGFEIFGRGATKMFDLANDWGTVLAHLDEFDPSKGGFGLTEEEMGQMSTLEDSINNIHSKWTALQNMAIVKLTGDLAMNLTGNASGILDAFLEYFNAEDDAARDAAIQKMADHIEAGFQAICDAVEKGLNMMDEVASRLQQSDNPTAQAIGNILGGLVDGLKWITEDNMRNVVTALEVLAGFWLVGKGAQMGAKIAEIVKNIGVIKTWNGKNGNTPAVPTTGSQPAAGGDGTTTVAPVAGKHWFTGLAGRAADGFRMMGGWGTFGTLAALAGAGVAGAKMIEANLQDENLNAIYGQEGGQGDLIETMGEAAAKAAAEYWRIYQDQSQTGTEAAYDARDALYAALADQGYENTEQGVSLIEGIFDEFLRGTDVDGLVAKMQELHPEIFGQGPAAPAEAPAETQEPHPEIIGQESAAPAEAPAEAGGSRVTDAQRTAMENFWDAWRSWERDDTPQHEDAFDRTWDELREAFAGQDELFQEVNTLLNELGRRDDFLEMSDLPQNWFTQQNGEQLTQGDIQGFRGLPAQIAAAVQAGATAGASAGVSGIRVTLDGYMVGQLVAPYVSQQIAFSIPG